MHGTNATEAVSGRTLGGNRPILLSVAIVTICVLLALFVKRVWALGITSHDDATWILAAFDPSSDIVGQTVRDQGRFWGLIAHEILLYTLRHQGTFFGELLRHGTFAAFFVCLWSVLSLYVGRVVAWTAGLLYIGLYAVTWEGSLLHSYPAFTWILGLAFLGAVASVRHYQRGGSALFLLLSALLLAFSMFNQEGMELLQALLFCASIYANWKTSPVLRRRGMNAAFAAVAVLVAFFGASAIFKLMHPSIYEGHVLSFSPSRFLLTLLEAATSGNVIFDIVQPYSATFTDRIVGGGRTVVYPPFGLGVSSTALMAGALAALAFFILALRSQARRSIIPALFIGLTIMFVHLAPVALTAKYQSWLLEQPLRAYSHTMVAHFGVALILAAAAMAALAALPERARIAAGAGLALVVGILSAAAYQMNDRIVADVRPEAGRWRVVDTAAHLISEAGMADASVFIAPRLGAGTWFASLEPSYFNRYAELRHGMPLKFRPDAIDPAAQSQGAAYLDYQADTSGTGFIIRAARIVREGPPLVDRIAVAIQSGSQADLSKVLIFNDRVAGRKQIRLSDLPKLAGNDRLRMIDGLAADPATMRIADDTEVP